MSQLSLSTRARTVFRNGLRPQTPIPRSHYATIAAGSVGLLLGLWAVLSYGGFVRPTYFLPTPTEVLTSAVRMARRKTSAVNGTAAMRTNGAQPGRVDDGAAADAPYSVPHPSHAVVASSFSRPQ